MHTHGRQVPPPPPPRPPARPKDSSHGGSVSNEGMHDDLPLFDAVYVVSMEMGGGAGGQERIFPSSSEEAFKLASQRCPPRITWRFPARAEAAAGGVSEKNILMFCFPDKEAIRPVRPENFVAEEFVFVVTDSAGGKTYGFCRRVLYRGPGGRYDTGRYRLPECLCLVSRRPFFGLFHSVLAIAQALRLLHDPDAGTTTALSDPRNACGAVGGEGVCKLEGFLHELWVGTAGGMEGVPGPGKELSACGHRFVRPVDEHMSLDDIAVTPLLVRLGARNFLLLLSGILCERRTVFVAKDVRTLSECVHAASSMLYPFTWQHMFIPLLPTEMVEYASAPVPFVIGVRYSQLDAVKRQPMNEAVFVYLDEGEVRVGVSPVADICDGVKETLASASQKWDKALGKLALLGRSAVERGARDERDKGGGGKSREGINDTASTLFAEVKAIYLKAKKTNKALGGPMVTAEDYALRAALLAFHVGLFGDHRTILRKKAGQGEPQVDRDFFLRHRREQRGDSESVLRFLQEFTQSQMFHMHMMHIKERLYSRQRSSSNGSPAAASSNRLSPVTFMRVSDELIAASAISPFGAPSAGTAHGGGGDGGFSPEAVRKALGKVLAEVHPGGSASAGNAYGDPTLNPTALDATSNTPSKRDASALRGDICKEAWDSAKLGGIMRVVWTRLADCGGNSWRHGVEGLRLLKALLLSGPVSCLADALSHIPAVRGLTRYPKGLEKAGVGGGGEEGQAAPRMRGLAREVVSLMMDVKRLALRREGLMKLQERKASPSSGGCERIRLRSRALPDFHTFHSMVGQAALGEASDHAAISTADSDRFYSRGSSIGSSVGGLLLQDEEGDGGDGSLAGWQDWTSLPVVAGDGADEDSSDGDEDFPQGAPPRVPYREDSPPSGQEGSEYSGASGAYGSQEHSYGSSPATATAGYDPYGSRGSGSLGRASSPPAVPHDLLTDDWHAIRQASAGAVAVDVEGFPGEHGSSTQPPPPPPPPRPPAQSQQTGGGGARTDSSWIKTNAPKQAQQATPDSAAEGWGYPNRARMPSIPPSGKPAMPAEHRNDPGGFAVNAGGQQQQEQPSWKKELQRRKSQSTMESTHREQDRSIQPGEEQQQQQRRQQQLEYPNEPCYMTLPIPSSPSPTPTSTNPFSFPPGTFSTNPFAVSLGTATSTASTRSSSITPSSLRPSQPFKAPSRPPTTPTESEVSSITPSQLFAKRSSASQPRTIPNPPANPARGQRASAFGAGGGGESGGVAGLVGRFEKLSPPSVAHAALQTPIPASSVSSSLSASSVSPSVADSHDYSRQGLPVDSQVHGGQRGMALSSSPPAGAPSWQAAAMEDGQDVLRQHMLRRVNVDVPQQSALSSPQGIVPSYLAQQQFQPQQHSQQSPPPQAQYRQGDITHQQQQPSWQQYSQPQQGQYGYTPYRSQQPPPQQGYAPPQGGVPHNSPPDPPRWQQGTAGGGPYLAGNFSGNSAGWNTGGNSGGVGPHGGGDGGRSSSGSGGGGQQCRGQNPFAGL